jgi:hypothetical protein
MKYPIFNSFIKQLHTELQRRSIRADTFTQWDESILNATGLEIGIPVMEHSKTVRDVVIHFDWDLFREAALARRLPGMTKHPLAGDAKTAVAPVEASLDVEVTWRLDTEPFKRHNDRVERSSAWMEAFNRLLKQTYPHDDAITRWHVEIEGDAKGRYLSVMSLITYITVRFDSVNDLNDVHRVITRTLQRILIRTNRILQLADSVDAHAA